MIFQNRKHAGQVLADQLQKYQGEDTIVLALPRGGVPVAAPIAEKLGVPVHILAVRKIGSPLQPELAAGAICEDADPIWNNSILCHLGLEPDDLGSNVVSEKRKIERQVQMFRRGRALPSLFRKTVIVVDDGLATGATMMAAVRYLKNKAAAKIIVAVPVAASKTARALRDRADEVIVAEEREDLMSVGQWYYDFSQVSDEEVLAILDTHIGFANLEIRDVRIPVDGVALKGDLWTFPDMKALIIFAHGSGSSRKSPRNQEVARDLNARGFGTLLFDLLTDSESLDRKNVFNIEFLAHRLVHATQWLNEQSEFHQIPIGYFGASTGAAAALRATAQLNEQIPIYTVVSRGGRPDLAGDALRAVQCPVLLLVGDHDFTVVALNEQAQLSLANCELSLVPGATHLFEEPGTLEEVSRRAGDWFNNHLPDGQKPILAYRKNGEQDQRLNR